jgi:hypothetical protein
MVLSTVAELVPRTPHGNDPSDATEDDMRWTAGSVIVLFTANCWAQENREFNDLIGVWAHNSAACSDYTNGKVDRLPDRASKTPYELIGICANGIDLLYQPVGCRTNAANVSAVSKFEVDSTCSVKDYEAEQGHFRIEVTGPNSISFHESDFTGNFSIFGDYVRCEHHYLCSERVNEIGGPTGGNR